MTDQQTFSERAFIDASGSPRVVFRFMLKGGEYWNWPVSGRDGIAAFRELLDRARVVYTEHEADA